MKFFTKKSLLQLQLCNIFRNFVSSFNLWSASKEDNEG